MEVAGANRRWRWPFRYRGSRHESAVAQLFSLGISHQSHYEIMKTTLPICCSVFLIAGVAWGQDSMTLEQFNTLVAAPGDTNALRAELASLPFWKVAKCSTAFKLPDGVRGNRPRGLRIVRLIQHLRPGLDANPVF